MNILKEAGRAVRDHKYEIDPDRGLHLPRARVYIGGMFTGRYAEPSSDKFGRQYISPNRVPAQGLNLILNLLGNHAAIPAGLYLAPFSGNVTPDDAWEADTFATDATELNAQYTSGTRLPWTTVASTTKLLSNAAALAAATLTFAAGGPYTVRGCGLLTSSVKAGTAGSLIVASRFDADLTGMTAGGKLALQYDLGAIDEADVP